MNEDLQELTTKRFPQILSLASKVYFPSRRSRSQAYPNVTSSDVSERRMPVPNPMIAAELTQVRQEAPVVFTLMLLVGLESPYRYRLPS